MSSLYTICDQLDLLICRSTRNCTYLSQLHLHLGASLCLRGFDGDDLVEPMNDVVLDMLMEDIHICLGELACRDLLLEEHVELRKGSPARLWQTEKGINNTEETDDSLRVWSVFAQNSQYSQ